MDGRSRSPPDAGKVVLEDNPYTDQTRDVLVLTALFAARFEKGLPDLQSMAAGNSPYGGS